MINNQKRPYFVVEATKCAVENGYRAAHDERFVRLNENSTSRKTVSFLLGNEASAKIVTFANATIFSKRETAETVCEIGEREFGGPFRIRCVEWTLVDDIGVDVADLAAQRELVDESSSAPITKSPMLDITIRLHQQTGHVKAYAPGSLYCRCGPVGGAFMTWGYDQTQTVILPRSLTSLVESESKWIAVYSHDSDEYLQIVGVGDTKDEAYYHLFFPTPETINDKLHLVFGRLVEPLA